MAEEQFDGNGVEVVPENAHPVEVQEPENQLVGGEPDNQLGGGELEIQVGGGEFENQLGSGEPENELGGGEPENQLDGSEPVIQLDDVEPENQLGRGESENQLGGGESENQLGGGGEMRWPGWPGENIFRMLIPVQKVGGVIGRKGEYIKRTCEETKARIKILDGPPGTTERTVLISAKEEPDLPVPPAMDGLLKIHKQIIDAETEPTAAVGARTFCTRLLLPAAQAASLIGKQGVTIKSVQDESHCIIRVLGGENLPVFALSDDSVVEVQGEPAGVHKAIELIANHLRKFLVDRSVVNIFETQMQNTNTRGNQDMMPPQSWGPPNQTYPTNAGSGPGYGGGGYGPPSYMPPPQRQFDNYYPQVDTSPLDKQPRQGPPSYGRDAHMGQPPAASTQRPPSIVTKVSQNMQIPLKYADAVIGIAGGTISYIRRASGATIAIQETMGVPDEMTVEINGSASQVQTAQQLIQNYIAGAAAQDPSVPPSQPAQGYNPYAGHGSAYPPQPANPAGPGHAPTGDYAQVYGGNYGY